MRDTTEPVSTSKQGPVVEPLRRRLIKGGIAATPVLLTVSSRPVFGQMCAAPSAATSIALSSAPHAKSVACSGETPQFWAGTTEWPDPYIAVSDPSKNRTATLFVQAFPATPSPFQSNDVTMLDVLKGTVNGANIELARYITASLLNASAGRLAPVLTEADIRGIWKDYMNVGYFEPTAGIKWYDVEITNYLMSTMSA